MVLVNLPRFTIGFPNSYQWHDCVGLGLKGEMTSLNISTVTGSENHLDTQRVHIGIESRGGTSSQIIRAWTKQSITPGLKVIN